MIPLTGHADLSYQPDRVERFNLLVNRLPDGNPIFIPVQIICGTRPGPRLAALAGVHGDELEGVRAIQSLIAAIAPAQLAGTLILIPVVNVMAFNACARRSPLDHIDLNRVFPGNPAGSISEQLAHRLCYDLLAGSDLVISLHGWSQNGAVHPWLEFVDIPTVAGLAAHEAACAFGIPDLVGLPLLPGRLISALAELAIPAIEGEVGGQASFAEANWRIFADGVRNVLHHLGMVTAGAGAPAITPAYFGLRSVVAPAGGLFQPAVKLGEQVHAGQELGAIFDLFGQPITGIVAPCSGKVSSLQTVGLAQAGAQLFTLLEPTTSAPFPAGAVADAA